jgi:hypothetical protein
MSNIAVKEGDTAPVVAYVIIGIASLGLIAFVINFIRCRMARVGHEEYDPENQNVMMQNRQGGSVI